MKSQPCHQDATLIIRVINRHNLSAKFILIYLNSLLIRFILKDSSFEITRF